MVRFYLLGKILQLFSTLLYQIRPITQEVVNIQIFKISQTYLFL